MKRTASIAIALVTLLGCQKDNPVSTRDPFEVTVRSQDDVAVEGATIEGGIDWTHFSVQTNAAGVATVPGSTYGQGVVIYKTNFIPLNVSALYPVQLTLHETSKKLNLIGNVAGKAVRFRQNELITLDYGGTYHLYSYSDQSIFETFSRHLSDPAIAIHDFKILGDTLWFTTHESGVFVFSIRNPSSPTLLFQVPVPGYLGPFAVKDSLLILGSMWNPGPLRVLVYYPTGAYRELSRVENYYVRSMTRVGDAVALLGNSESLPTVFDVTDPRLPRLLYNGLEYEYQTGFFYKSMAVLTPWNGYGGNSFRLDCRVVDLSNPANPVKTLLFSSDSYLTGIASDNLAYGTYYAGGLTISVLSGSMNSSFQTVATVSENTIDGVGGTFPPYFIIGGRLWKLVDR